MRITLILMLLVGCESMEPSGSPFEAAPSQAPAPSATPATATPGDPEFDLLEREDFSLSSEEMQENAAIGQAPAADHGVEAPAPASPTDLSAPPAPPAAEITAIAAPPPPAAAPTGAWPVRLVSTVPMAQPPRAILALANGEEVVVSPGDLLPSERLVVLAIGTGTLEAARITPAGDHATVDALTLTAQY